MENLNWWNNLSDEEKIKAYNRIEALNRNNENTINEIVDHLLGTGFYTMAYDTYGCNKEIIDAIKSNYPNVNNNLSNTWKKIKNALIEYFN